MQRIPRPRVGLTFDEAVELKGKASFPMTMATVNDHLRSRGYDCYKLMLKSMIKHKVVTPIFPNIWLPRDVEAAAEHLEDANIFRPHALMCFVLGGCYVDFLRALRAAADRESAKYGQRVPACDQFFVIHRMPPRDVEGPDGKNILQLARFTFTLCDDVREQLERGELG